MFDAAWRSIVDKYFKTTLHARESRKKERRKESRIAECEKKEKFINKNKDRLCYKCGVTGHISTDCHAPAWKVEKYKKSREEEKEKEKSNEINNEIMKVS